MERPSPALFLYEGDRLPSAVNDQEAELRDLLLAKGVLRPLPDGSLTVRFVGVAVAGKSTLVFLPKVRVNAPPEVVQQVTLRALRTYSRWLPPFHEPSPHLNADPDRGEVSGIAMADWLIRDFMTHGLYRRAIVRLDTNGGGQTDWRHTIAARDPIFSHGKPIYPTTSTRGSTADPSNFATVLHLHLLESMSRDFGKLLDYEPITLDLEPVERLEILPSAEECERRLFDEMRVVFADRSIQLLIMLAAAVRSREMERSVDLALFGTSSFHHVWEQACGLICGNEVEAWGDELPTPVWRAPDGSSQIAETFRPDIVAPLNDAKNRLLIADAKYYRSTPPPTLQSVPGVNDVAKQVWYKQYLTPKSEEATFSGIENVFLFPGEQGELVRRWGSVDFPDGGERVDVLSIDIIQALRCYSSRNTDVVGPCRASIAAVLDVSTESVMAA